MGMGEPLMNYKNLIDAIDKITQSDGLGMSPSRITVSTSGIPKMMIKPDVFATKRSKESYEKYGGFLPIYEKENALDLFNKYDQICVIDADIWVRPNAPSIFHELDVFSGTTEFAGVVERLAPILPWYKEKLKGYTRMQYSNLTDVDWEWNEDGALFYNMGLMLMDRNILKYLRGQTGKEFIQRPEFKDFVDGQGAWKWSTDQTLLNYWVKKEKMIHSPATFRKMVLEK